MTADDNGNNFSEKLVELVSKHSIIYDNTEDGYANSLAQDETWRQIAGELNEDVAACKLKWKNIRSCYTRYLRRLSQNPKTTKTYYLAKRLSFLSPFCRTYVRRGSEVCSEDNSGSPFLHHEDVEVKTEPDDGETSTKQEPDDEFGEESNGQKRQAWETNSDDEFAKRTRLDDSDEAELHFFKSLLPDIRKMDSRQKSKLKIAILNAIDSILYNES